MGKYGMFMGFSRHSQLFFGGKWLGMQISEKKSKKTLRNLFVRLRSAPKFVRPRRANLEFLFQERYGFRQLMRHVGLPVRWKL